jgi:hypothetical protein
MGICVDSSIKALRQLGYNVVRLPREAIKPLQLIGVQNGETIQLGGLDKLIVSSTSALPDIVPNEQASNVNGRKSSELSIAVGLNILGAIIGSMGGDLSVKSQYKSAKSVTFEYTDVTGDAVAPLDVGQYLRNATIDVDNKIVEQYVLGNGRLYLIIRTLKSNTFRVEAKTSFGGTLELQVPQIRELVGGDVTVEGNNESASVVSYRGKVPLVFGFQCLDVGVYDGVISLETTAAGTVAMTASGEPKNVMLDENGLLDMKSP